MQDIAIENGDLFFKNNDLLIISNSEALIEQLYVFLNVRSIHKDGDGNRVESGELLFDQNQGIDFIKVLEVSESEEQILNHYKSQILTYYGDYITEITEMAVEKNKVTREIKIEFEYKTIWSNEPQKFKMGG